jgi:hypothetical protein
MRFKDYFQLLGVSLTSGFLLSVIFYFVWSEEYLSTRNSFWISWTGLSVLSLPIGYWVTKKGSTCTNCRKPFVLSEDGQTDIENFVKFKSESVTENGITRTKNVPYNVRRYYQHMKCDNCSLQFKFEARQESRA